MKKVVISATLGLSVLASSLVSAPASAFQLKNFQNQTLYLGIAAGTPTAGNKFIVWTHDVPASGNQTFSVTGAFIGTPGSPASSVVPGSQINLFDGVAMSALVDIVGNTANDGTSVVVGYSSNLGKQLWRVDDSVGIRSNGSPCYRFVNATSANSKPEVIGVSGGNPQKGGSIITYHTFSDYWNHYDQFWCVVD